MKDRVGLTDFVISFKGEDLLCESNPVVADSGPVLRRWLLLFNGTRPSKSETEACSAPLSDRLMHLICQDALMALEAITEYKRVTPRAELNQQINIRYNRKGEVKRVALNSRQPVVAPIEVRGGSPGREQQNTALVQHFISAPGCPER